MAKEEYKNLEKFCEHEDEELQVHDKRIRKEERDKVIDKISKLFASKVQFLNTEVAAQNNIDYRIIEWSLACGIFAQLEKENERRRKGSTMSKWIAFKDLLPEKDQDIFLCGVGLPTVHEAQFDFNLKLFVEQSRTPWFWQPRIFPTHIDLEGEEE